MNTTKMTKMDKILFIDAKQDNSKRENANINGNSAMGKMLQIGSYYSNEYTDKKLLPPIISKGHKDGDFHVHDKDFLAIGTATCLSGDTYITIKDETGKIINTTLNYLDKYLSEENNLYPEIKEISNLYILGRNGWTKLNKVMRRKLNNEDILYYLKTKKGLGLKVTDKHKIPVIRNNEELLLKAKDIQIGDELLNAPYIKEIKDDTLNLIEEFSHSTSFDLDEFVICNIDKLKKWLLYKYDIHNLSTLINSQNSNHGTKYITIQDYNFLNKNYELPYEVLISLHIKAIQSKNSIPILLPVTNELAKVFGYIYSESNLNIDKEKNVYTISFVNYNQQMNLLFEDCFKKTFPCFISKCYSNGKESGRLISDKVIVCLLKHILGYKKNSSEIRIPNFILNGDKELKYSFISSIIDGDEKILDKCKIVYNTVSENSAKDLSILLSSLEIDNQISIKQTKGTTTSIYGKQYTKNHDIHSVVVTGKENLLKILENINCIKTNEVILDYARKSRTVQFNTNKIIDKIELDKDIYVYDLETTEHWFLANNYVVHNCSQINLNKLFKNGFSTSHGYIREPKKISSYTALTAIALQSNQNDQHGGQSINAFDYYMEKGVLYSYEKQLIQHLVLCLEYELDIEYGLDLKLLQDETIELTDICNDEKLINFIEKTKPTTIEENKNYWINFTQLLQETFEIQKSRALLITKKVQKNTIKHLDNEVFQAMEGLIHNLNTMHSRAGSQVPFTSINFGTCTSPEGRMATKNLLLAHNEGLGNKETPIFPILIFKVKEGINFNVEDKNYDLFKLACKVASRRLFPNFSFVDAPFNLQYYKEDDYNTEAAYMGCVDGTEIITYKYKDNLRVESFEKAWRFLSSLFTVKNQGYSEYCELEDVFIYDSNKKGFVVCKKILKNPDKNDWNKITFNNGKMLLATSDHPLPIKDKGRTFVKDMCVGDKVPVAWGENARDKNIQYVEVTSIEFLGFRNKESYDVETESDMFDVSGIQSHNCRTRTISDVHGEDVVDSKGNISFTTINLPRLGIICGEDINLFFKKLDKQINLVIKQLLKRYELQCSLTVKNFPFVVGQNIWAGGEHLTENDTIEDVLKHGSLSVGFIGLAETLIALTGEHHGESEESQQLGIKIIKHMRKRIDEATKKHQLNFALIATPAEGLSNRFTDLDRAKYGEIDRITDKEYYTNSFHIPVDFKLSISKKLELEAPYHELTNGGHISYVELDGDVSKNPEVIESIVRLMRKYNIGYGSINFKVDNCLSCGYGGIIDDDCPVCKSNKIKRIRRVTGYLSDVENFNMGKQAEEKNRTLHTFS